MDFPKKGVNFLDIFSATSKPEIFKKIMEGLKRLIIEKIGQPGTAFTHIVGLESKGFVLGPILCLEWNLPFVPIRKKGKLPGECWEVDYTTEYSNDCVQIQKSAFPAGSVALVLDDLIATGGTLVAAEKLIANIPETSIAGHVCIFEIDLLKGREKVTKRLETLIHLRDIE